MSIQISFLLCGVLLLSYANNTFIQNNVPPNLSEQTTTMSNTEALHTYKQQLLALPGVVGTAQSICNSQPCIKIYVVQNTPELEQQIADILQDNLFEIRESGRFDTRTPPTP